MITLFLLKATTDEKALAAAALMVLCSSNYETGGAAIRLSDWYAREQPAFQFDRAPALASLSLLEMTVGSRPDASSSVGSGSSASKVIRRIWRMHGSIEAVRCSTGGVVSRRMLEQERFKGVEHLGRGVFGL